MQLNQIGPKHKFKKSKRVGRGGKRGTYSGRGIKGQKSRAGAKFEPIIRRSIKKYPKLKGYRLRSVQDLKREITVLNLEILEKKFKKGEKINPEALFEKRLLRKIKGKMPKVKILGKGEITKPLTFVNCQVSKSAKEKIEKAGGKVNISS